MLRTTGRPRPLRHVIGGSLADDSPADDAVVGSSLTRSSEERLKRQAGLGRSGGLGRLNRQNRPSDPSGLGSQGGSSSPSSQVGTDSSAQDSQFFDSQPSARKGPSLKARAISLLSRRDQSRVELQRKLATYAESPEAIDSVIQALELEGFFSETRFAQSFARRRGERYGVARVKQELNGHKLEASLMETTVDALKKSEFIRGYEVWSRRFDALATDSGARVKQQRFLAGRGFSMSVIAKIIKGEIPDTEEPT